LLHSHITNIKKKIFFRRSKRQRIFSLFLFCFTRELTLYSPLTLSLTSARELKPYTPPLPSPSAHLSAHTSYTSYTAHLSTQHLRPPSPPTHGVKRILKFVYFEQQGGFNELNLRLWFIFVTADKVGMNRTLHLGLLVLSLLGLLPLRLCCLLSGVVVLGSLPSSENTFIAPIW